MAITRLGGANAITGTLPAANINDTSIGNITALPAGVGGKVLQVVTDVHSTQITTASPGGAQVDSGLSASITPSSTSNKILVLLSIQIQENKDSSVTLYWRTIIKANGSSIHNGQNAECVNNTTGEFGLRTSIQLLHSPNSTSQQTYTVEVKNDDGLASNMVINRSNSPAYLTLMEVAG